MKTFLKVCAGLAASFAVLTAIAVGIAMNVEVTPGQAVAAPAAPVVAEAKPAPDPFLCNRPAELAEIFYDDRRNGGTEEAARKALAASGEAKFAYAASLAYRTPTNVSKWIVRGTAFQQCQDYVARGVH